MIYPEFIRKGETIGICAPSAGVGKKIPDFEASLDTLHKCGYKTKETASVRVLGDRSADGKTRAEELNQLFADDEVRMVMSAAGGDFLSEILPYVDFGLLKKNPKWLTGASDPTGILFPYTVSCDVATLYGFNAGSFDTIPLPDYLKNALSFVKGKLITQKSFDMYMKTPGFLAEKIEFDTPVQWLSTVGDISVKGRCIGGCIDVLKDLIGTRFETVKDFDEKYKDDGLIWYFDNFSLSAEVFYRTLLQMRYAGWFDHTNAVIVGRVLFESSDTGMTYAEAIERALEGIPVLYQADVGHTIPSMTMINGAILDVTFKKGRAALRFSLV